MTEEGSWTLSNGFWPLPLCLGLVVFLKISEFKDQKRIRYITITLSVLLTCIDFVAMGELKFKSLIFSSNNSDIRLLDYICDWREVDLKPLSDYALEMVKLIFWSIFVQSIFSFITFIILLYYSCCQSTEIQPVIL